MVHMWKVPRKEAVFSLSQESISKWDESEVSVALNPPEFIFESISFPTSVINNNALEA